MRMKHLTADKMNSRGAGRREVRTHQPTGGRGNEGGMRIGEMELHALEAHGTTLFLQESLMKRADATNFWVCNGCGTIPIYNEKEGLFVCPMCDGPVEFSGTTEETLTLIKPLRRSRVTFSKVEIPYSLKLLDQEITTFTSTGFRFVTERSVGRLRDNMLKVKQGGGGQPVSPESYVRTVNEALGLTPAPLVQDKGPEGAPPEVIYAGATEDLPPIFKGGASPINSIDTVPITQQQYLAHRGGGAPIDSIGSDTKPITQQQYLAHRGGSGSIDNIGSDTKPITQQEYLAQRGGAAPIDYVDPVPPLQTSDTIYVGGAAPVDYSDPTPEFPEGRIYKGGSAPIDSIGKDPVPVRHTLEEIWPSPQSGGMAPVDSLGKDPVPVRHTLEEIWPSPQSGGVVSIGRDLEPVKYTPEDDAKSQPGLQIGAGLDVDAFEIVRATVPAPIEAIGTVNFNQATFSQPAMAQEPYVVANPYTSPPLTSNEVKMPAAPTYIVPVSASIVQSVDRGLVADVAQVVQQGGAKQNEEHVTTIFENADIRVVKLE